MYDVNEHYILLTAKVRKNKEKEIPLVFTCTEHLNYHIFGEREGVL